jgi:hypothetical protein
LQELCEMFNIKKNTDKYSLYLIKHQKVKDCTPTAEDFVAIEKDDDLWKFLADFLDDFIASKNAQAPGGAGKLYAPFLTGKLLSKKVKAYFLSKAPTNQTQGNFYEFYDAGRIVKIKKNTSSLGDEKNLDRPVEPIYSKSDVVACIFCQNLSSQKDLVRQLGPLYGPFNFEKRKIYFHEMCALWMPGIFMNKNNKLQNWKQEIHRSLGETCNICSAKGGGLKCFHKNCTNTFHYYCVLNNPETANLNPERFSMYCSDHTVEFFAKYPELCNDPWVCKVCDKNERDYDVLLCDDCDQGWHLDCLDPPLEEIPDGEWYCEGCLIKEFLD